MPRDAERSRAGRSPGDAGSGRAFRSHPLQLSYGHGRSDLRSDFVFPGSLSRKCGCNSLQRIVRSTSSRSVSIWRLRVRVALTSDAGAHDALARYVDTHPGCLSSTGQSDLPQLISSPLRRRSPPATKTSWVEWHLESAEGNRHLVRFEPRLGCSNMATVRNAAADGKGVALAAGPCLPRGVARRPTGPGAASLARSARDRASGLHARAAACRQRFAR